MLQNRYFEMNQCRFMRSGKFKLSDRRKKIKKSPKPPGIKFFKIGFYLKHLYLIVFNFVTIV